MMPRAGGAGDETREGPGVPAALEAMTALTSALAERGLDASRTGEMVLSVRNPQAEPLATDPLGRAMSPGLRQSVVLLTEEGRLLWHWVWSGPSREAPPELEAMCPASEADTAADRIARVLAVPDTTT